MRRRVLGLKAAAMGSRQVSDTSKLKDLEEEKDRGGGGRGGGAVPVLAFRAGGLGAGRAGQQPHSHPGGPLPFLPLSPRPMVRGWEPPPGLDCGE